MAEEVNVEQAQHDKLAANQSQLVEKPTKSQGSLVFTIINFVLILVLAGALYYLLQEMKDKQIAHGDEISKDDMREIEFSKQFNAFQSQLATMQSQIATFNEEIAGKDIHYTKTLADYSRLHTEKLNGTQKNLTAEIAQLKRQLGKTRGDWLVADAEYLLTVANQRLHLMSDVKTARMAMEAADQRLRESGDTAAFKVREQIAKEIAGLSSVSLPDIVGMNSSVQLLKDKVETLAVILPYAGKPLTESKQVHDHDTEQEGEHGILNTVQQALEGYVTVKHSDHPVTTILTEEEAGFIKQQLNVKLEMIKIALVQQSDTLYRSSIEEAKQWLNRNFTKNTSSKNFQIELDKLNNIQLRSQLPDVSLSLKMLKDITKLRIEADKAQIETEEEPVIENSSDDSLSIDTPKADAPKVDTPKVDTPKTDRAIGTP